MAYIRKTNNPKSGRPSASLNYDIRVRVNDELNTRLEEYAKSNNMPKAEAVRYILTSFLAENAESNYDEASDVTSATELGDDSPYLYLESKQVPDSDGFYTDYTLYLNTDTGNYICMFGDNDLYEPDEDYADFVTDSKERAYEWFENYSGFEDDEDPYVV